MEMKIFLICVAVNGVAVCNKPGRPLHLAADPVVDMEGEVETKKGMKDENWKKKLEYLKTLLDLKAAKYHDKPVKIIKNFERYDGFSKQEVIEKHGITQGEISEIAHMRWRMPLKQRLSPAFPIDFNPAYDMPAVLEFYPENAKVTDTEDLLTIEVWYKEM